MSCDSETGVKGKTDGFAKKLFLMSVVYSAHISEKIPYIGVVNFTTHLIHDPQPKHERLC